MMLFTGLPDPEPQGVPIPPLAPGERPNFIVIMTDDQGWDDVGLHQPHKPGETPKFVNTPNIDKFLKRSTKFDNFYVTPMCAQSRAELMTGRAYPKTGTMLVSGGEMFSNLISYCSRFCWLVQASSFTDCCAYGGEMLTHDKHVEQDTAAQHRKVAP